MESGSKLTELGAAGDKCPIYATRLDLLHMLAAALMCLMTRYHV